MLSIKLQFILLLVVLLYWSGCGIERECGNGVLEPGEACDGGDFGDKTCVSESFLRGNLICDPATCQISTAQCVAVEAECGNGKRDNNEECDGLDTGGALCPDSTARTCNDDCTLGLCDQKELTSRDFVDSLRKMYGQRACQYVFDCPELASDVFSGAGRFESKEDCIAQYKHYNFIFEPLKLGANSSRVEFDKDMAVKCLSDYEARSSREVCVQPSSLVLFDVSVQDFPLSCARVFMGNQNEESPCSNEFECEAGLTCSIEEGECEGKCLKRGFTVCGQSVCDPSKVCHSESKTCLGRRLVGETCLRNGAMTMRCANGLYCNSLREANLCVAKWSGGEGTPCSGDQACRRDLHCDFNTRVCTPDEPQDLAERGESCSYFLQSVKHPERCVPGMTCTERVTPENAFPFEYEGVCNPVLGRNEPCAETAQCSPGFYCSEFNESGICVETKLDGDRCDFAFECKSNACFNSLCSGSLRCQ